jgi:prepilin-type N-terminal cleavage/methylation domain-containing protein
MRRAGFTLIEILIVVGIIVIMLATAVMSVASGRGSVQVKEATRGVIQLSRYASALALLRQRPVVVTFHHNGKIEVRISGEATGSGEVGKPSDPIYREVEGKQTLTAEEYAADSSDDEADLPDSPKGKGASQTRGESEGEGEGKGGKGSPDDERNGLFFSRRVLDPEVLAKEDAEGEFKGVTFSVEVLGEDGEPLERGLAEARSLRQPKRERKSEDGELAEDEEQDETAEPPVSVTYETNGNVNPHRVIVRLEGESEMSEGFAINVSRSGKVTVGEDEEEEGGKRGSRKRRR